MLSVSISVLAGDHPRLRGEHAIASIGSCILLGSPPPTRGTPSSCAIASSLVRITPAYAGNTDSIQPIFLPLRDHPRLRGEHTKQAHQVMLLLGSPPPTRGTLCSTSIYSLVSRITPAYAGNTLYLALRILCRGDHPRLRGEHRYIPIKYYLFRGSPPPTRGTPVHSHKILSFQGITPAYAGNTGVRSMDA